MYSQLYLIWHPLSITQEVNALPSQLTLTDMGLNHSMGMAIIIPAILPRWNQVWRVLSQLDPSKAMGHDGLGPAILKACAVPLAAPLSRFFNQCMELSTIPVEWKLHIIVPIHKSGDKSLVNNYRPISLLCSTSKVLEKLIYKHLEDFIIPQISVYQFGFLKGRSCLHKLLVSLADIVDSVNRNLSTDVIYLDLRKAFDTVGHRELLAKLWSFGIHGRLWKWFANYLWCLHS